MNFQSMEQKVIPMFGYAVYNFPWGTAVKEERTNVWKKAVITVKTGCVEVDLEGLDVILHQNGIEFIPK